MNRVIRSSVAKKRRKKILNFNKGFFGSKSKLFIVANQQYMKSKTYAYSGRHARKRLFRKLWISRLTSGLGAYNIRYNVFINNLKKTSFLLDRKVLSKILLLDSCMFNKIANVEF